jgi:protein-tyrosine phosphatase
VVNVTSKEYTKRQKYFEYLNIDLHYNTEEDAKKFFRISNRFISNAIKQGGKVFVHASKMELGAVMILGYLIGV